MKFAYACLCTIAVGGVFAAGPEDSLTPQAAIEYRQAGFKKMGAAMKAIADQLKADTPAMASLAAPAQAVMAHAQQQFRWFPAGSGREAGVDTDALPNIWKDRAKFDSVAEQLIAESKTLAIAIAGDDLTAIRAQTKVVGSVCSTCHRSFRAD